MGVPLTELDLLRKQNALLQAMARHLAVALGELLDVLPDEMRALPNAQQAIRVCRQIRELLDPGGN
jgi:putative heme iron utilization protein